MDSPSINPLTIQSSNTPVKKKETLLISLIVLVILSFLIFLVLIFVFTKQSQSNTLVISNQVRSIGLTVDKLVLSKGGFLIITPTISPADAIFRSGFLSPGVYTGFDIPNFMLPSPGAAQTPPVMRGYLYADTNNSKQFEYSDQPLYNFLGKPVSIQFNLTENLNPPLSCNAGFSDSFNGDSLNKTLWYAYFLNQQKEGNLVQTAKDNAVNNSSTTLYSKDKFTGNLAVEVDISSFAVDHGPDADYQATAELTIFTETDRIISVKWIKSFGQSYLTPNISKFKTALQERYPVVGDGPLKIKIVRLGTTAQIYLATENSDYQKLWDIPDVATDDLHVGFESYDFSPIPTLVTSVVSNLSVSCP
jgi:hypothetical protein